MIAKGKWMSKEGIELRIETFSKNTISGIFKSPIGFPFKEKRFNGLILLNDNIQTIFTFIINCRERTKSKSEYYLILGKMNENESILNLVIAKNYMSHNQKNIDEIKRYKLSHI